MQERERLVRRLVEEGPLSPAEHRELLPFGWDWPQQPIIRLTDPSAPPYGDC